MGTSTKELLNHYADYKEHKSEPKIKNEKKKVYLQMKKNQNIYQKKQYKKNIYKKYKIKNYKNLYILKLI